jgi:hypothetical protein
MPNIEITFAHICENVIVANNNNLSVINIFNQVISQNFPALHPKIVIVVGTKGEEGEYPVNIKITKEEESQPMMEIKNGTIMKINGDVGQGRFIATFAPVAFKSSGTYNVDITIGDQSKRLIIEAKSS